MTNKTGIIALTAIIFILSVYYLSFTFRSRGISQAATQYATENKILDEKKKRAYLDSLWDSDESVYNLLVADYTYKEVKEKELSLGLDLQGGMHVTLEVSPIEIIKAYSGNNKNPKFRKAIKDAQEKQKDSQENFVDLFQSSYEAIADAPPLAKIFTNTSTRGKINFNSSNSEVIRVIRQEVEDAFDRSFQIIRTRIDKFGVANPNIQKLPGTNRILVELPGVDNPERVRKLLSGVAKLEFWEVWELGEVAPYYQQLAAYLVKEEQKKNLLNQPKTEKGDETPDSKEEDPLSVEDASDPLSIDTEEADPLRIEETPEEENDTLAPDTESTEETDSASQIIAGDLDDPLSIDSDTTVEVKDSVQQAKEDSTAAADSSAQAINAVAQLISPSMNEGVFRVKVKDTARVNEILLRDEVRTLFPSNMKFLWDVKPDEASNTIALFAIKRGRGGRAPVEGDVVVDARSDFDQGKPVVSMQMNATGAKKWKRMTGANVNRRIAIVLDNYVYSAPVVNGEIPNGSSQISGNFTVNEAKDLANILKAGKLPAPTRIVEEATVGPSLGQESINQGLTSILIGLALVVVFMILYYRSSGFVANLALLVNIFFILGILAQLGAVLTLAGMAGIVLTIGMSVDANVLIYERIREELRNNKGIKAAVKLGYEKAYSSIIDANATTFLTGVILYSFGSGGVKGFAVTLMIGIVCSLFSAIFITRLIIEAFINRKDNKFISFDSILFKESFQNFNINFVGLRRKAYIFSGAIITIGIILMVIQGLTLGVDFKGGRSYVVAFEEPVSVKDVRTNVGKQFEGSTEVKTFGGNNKLKITTSYLIEDESPEADLTVRAALDKGLESFKAKNPEVVSFSKVGATIADDIANTSFIAVLFSLLVIFLYIFVRFQKWQFGLGALVALIHDVLVVLSFMGIAQLLGFSLEIDQVFIAAMLTVVGYSINDTVVVFDRIREFAGDTQATNFGSELNKAINNTLSRTIMTSSTTLVVVFTLFLLGGEVLRGFSYALLIGVLIGTYSSVFIASPIVLDVSLLLNRLGKRDNKEIGSKKGKPSKA